MRSTLIALACLSLTALAVAQNQTLKFEVASIKPNRQYDTSYGSGCYSPTSNPQIPRGMCTAHNVPLSVLIGEAYGVDEFRIADLVIGGPGWMGSERYDVEAKAENLSATSDELQAMLRNLLRERFKLQVHEETREQTGYALRQSKDGVKLTQTIGEKRRYINVFRSEPPQLEATNVSIGDLAQYLSRMFHRPFIDNTGLDGHFDFMVPFEFEAPPLPTIPDLPQGARLILPLNDSALPGISDALQKHLGLQMQSQKVPVTLIVIDHAEKPNAN